jgi:pyrroline-5-carboxylate reductase
VGRSSHRGSLRRRLEDYCLKRSTLLDDVPVAFIGVGAMCEAMIGELLWHKLVARSAITVADLRPERLKETNDLFLIQAAYDNCVAVHKVHILVLSVKPQVLVTVCVDLNEKLRPSMLVLSIVMCVRIYSISGGLMHTSIVRTMPNIPAQVGGGMTIWFATDMQRAQVGAVSVSSCMCGTRRSSTRRPLLERSGRRMCFY